VKECGQRRSRYCSSMHYVPKVQPRQQAAAVYAPSYFSPKDFQRWGIDMVGPLKETSHGNKYIIVATEYLTRWPETQAVPDKSADGIHRFLTSLVCRFRSCHVFLHDQGREFNNMVKDLCKQLNTSVAMTSAYHTQSNG